MRALLLFLALLQPAPHFSARWDTKDSATVQWTQQARGCLSVEHATGQRVFIGCWEKAPQSVVLQLGGPGTDGAYRPTAGDVYVLSTGGQFYRTPLRARVVYLAVWRG